MFGGWAPPSSTGFAANMRLLWRMSGPHRHTAPSHTCTQVHTHVVAYVCMHAKCALTSPTTHVRMCSHKLALCNVTESKKQTSSNQGPGAHPVLPTSLPASHADLPPPRWLPAECEEAQAPHISWWISLPCQKSSRLGQMLPLCTVS